MLQMGVTVMAAAAVLGGPGGLLEGTLFMESHPPARSWESYTSSDSLKRPLRLNPCDREKAWDKGRVAARTMAFIGEAYDMKDEQLVVYKDVAHAKKAMRGLRAELARCADMKGEGHDRYRYFTKPVRVGDEGLRAGGLYFESSTRSVVVRRGAALYVVGESGRVSRSLPLKHFRGLIAQAEKMAVKVCDLPEAAC
ncbi:hypothetical protein [Nonomuraea lactucae]|uniref:hypothetical protein n=1 Tax=Nonomuraea lactucae TaxID=2249762 RepID=UPI000DE22A68|nr:hypothetical protein [Nonomuraea lactucae]